MNEEKIAKTIYDEVVREGNSTDNCYSKTFYEDCRKMAKNRAERRYFGEQLHKILEHIDKL
jgi:hypothetical protein